MSDPVDPRAVLAAPGSTLAAVLRAVEEVEQQPQERTVRIGISSAVTVDLLGTYLRRHGLLSGTAVQVVPGNHDDPIGDVERFLHEGVQHVVLVPFFDALLPAFEAQLPGLAPAALDALETSVRTRYRLALEAARPLPSVHLVTFHRMGSPLDAGGRDVVAAVLDRFDAALRDVAAGFPNTRLVDGADVVRTVGRDAAFDLRFWFRGKAPYTGAFLDELARRVTVAARGFGAPFRKVLALDCDGTLWGGVVGEDSVEGIALGPHDHPGNVFWQVQHEIAALRRAGVLLCLVSKNNPADVDEVLRDHPSTVLRDEDFVVKKVDWSDKPANVRALAAELGLGLDSIVFLDDSPFECEAMRQQLPVVTTVQVPARLSDYPRVVRGIGELFLAGGVTEESRDKTEQYRHRARAEELQAASVDQETYLASLQLTVQVRRDDPADAARISELSQKSNQFNLTTRRYGVSEVERLMADPEHAVYALVVGDVFGSAGLTGAVVVHRDGAAARVESFFLSCRVLGRGIETAVWPRVVADAVADRCTSLHADFRPTPKNAQVSDFWDRLGLSLAAEAADGSRSYCIAVDDFHTPTPAWIEMNCVG
ncbi:HAD-IIIC family phosphatase [Modestobacter muralis]|uniref:HAD-IIIC family phosphatase n=1 Tax=Modestobacter muralis TaxID=1608614 RepID=A0A6P0ET74_9ACTN|nr:HAD-IIIC family phosphatase [Modestobacter muralis]NEK94941.1 HAD-IIIC family phosphatase [Modestobacter muralis]NEN51829.1 HAD-IIIC family phosphatase [Modestobacter muralis]